MRREPTCKHAVRDHVRRSAHTGKGSWPMRRLSRNVRANNPFCQVCHEKPSTEVHHVVKWVDSVEGRLDPRNLVACCRACHELLEKQGGR